MNLNGFLSPNGNVSGSLGPDLVVAVEANPSGVATQPLIKLRVGDVIYGIPTGGGGGGTSDYNMLTNKPEINGVILQDELSLHSLGIQEEITFSGEATEYLNGEGVFTTPPFYVPINFDTAEQDTGIKWIDGKTLYIRTFDLRNLQLTDNNWNSNILGTSNIRIKFFTGMFSIGQNEPSFNYSYFRSTSEFFTVNLVNDASQLNVRPNMNAGTIYAGVVTILYTKVE